MTIQSTILTDTYTLFEKKQQSSESLHISNTEINKLLTGI